MIKDIIIKSLIQEAPEYFIKNEHLIKTGQIDQFAEGIIELIGKIGKRNGFPQLDNIVALKKQIGYKSVQAQESIEELEKFKKVFAQMIIDTLNGK